MTIRSRSLVSNSFSSVLSSGLLIFSTVLIPALFVRALSRDEFTLFSTILATLPLLSIIPQSVRNAAPSQLALANALADQWLATRAFLRFCLLVAAGLAVISTIGIEIYTYFDSAHRGQEGLFRFGLYCIVGHALGLIAIGLFSGPAGARHDFLPENFGKLWPGLYHLVGIAAIWIISPKTPLVWICLVYLTSSWTAALMMALKLRRTLYGKHFSTTTWRHSKIEKLFWSSFRGSAWQNTTAYLATSFAIMIMSILHSSSIVPFSIAASILGITSAGLIAISSPIASHAIAMRKHSVKEQRQFFLMTNTLFQLYIIVTGIFVLLMPQQIFILWLQPELAEEVRFFCVLLLPSSILRLLTMAFSVFVMGAGRQEAIWLSPLVEAALSVAGCLILGTIAGPIGVPLALAFSAAIRLLLTITYDERRMAAEIHLHRGDILFSSLRILKMRLS